MTIQEISCPVVLHVKEPHKLPSQFIMHLLWCWDLQRQRLRLPAVYRMIGHNPDGGSCRLPVCSFVFRTVEWHRISDKKLHIRNCFQSVPVVRRLHLHKAARYTMQGSLSSATPPTTTFVGCQMQTDRYPPARPPAILSRKDAADGVLQAWEQSFITWRRRPFQVPSVKIHCVASSEVIDAAALVRRGRQTRGERVESRRIWLFLSITLLSASSSSSSRTPSHSLNRAFIVVWLWYSTTKHQFRLFPDSKQSTWPHQPTTNHANCLQNTPWMEH